MSYTPTSWTTGDTITAAAMNKIENGIANAGGGAWDAVIRLTHSNDTGADDVLHLTPSIVSGSFAQLHDKISGGGCPCILVEYYHPYGYRFAIPMGYVKYVGERSIIIQVVGVSAIANWSVIDYGELFWDDEEAIGWN